MVSLCILFIKVQCRPMFKSAFFSCANGLLEVSHTVHHAQVKKVECIVKSVSVAQCPYATGTVIVLYVLLQVCFRLHAVMCSHTHV